MPSLVSVRTEGVWPQIADVALLLKQNALQTLTAPIARPAAVEPALKHAELTPVVTMPFATVSTMCPVALAHQATSAIQDLNAIQVRLFFLYIYSKSDFYFDDRLFELSTLDLNIIIIIKCIFLNIAEARQPTTWECYSDDDCGQERTCIDRICINPCDNSCGLGALCRVINHKAICSCPRGYTGDATIRCIPRKYPGIKIPIWQYLKP